MPGQEPAPVVALIEKQADGVALGETEFKLNAILADCEPLWGRVAEDQLWRSLRQRRAAHLPIEELVIGATRIHRRPQGVQLLQLSGGERIFALRQQVIAQPLHIPPRPAITRAVGKAEAVRFIGINERNATRGCFSRGGSPFPLTPALSLGERERGISACWRTCTLRF